MKKRYIYIASEITQLPGCFAEITREDVFSTIEAAKGIIDSWMQLVYEEHPACDVYAVHEDDRIIMYMDDFAKIFTVREICLKFYDNDEILIFRGIKFCTSH